MDAGDRRVWSGDQDLRPLSELGQRQAQLLCDVIAKQPCDALFSSPALRCRQTIEPLARRFGLEIAVLHNLRETEGFQVPEGWAGRFSRTKRLLGAPTRPEGWQEQCWRLRKQRARGELPSARMETLGLHSRHFLSALTASSYHRRPDGAALGIHCTSAKTAALQRSSTTCCRISQTKTSQYVLLGRTLACPD